MSLEVWWGTPVWYFDVPYNIINTDTLEHECYDMMQKKESADVSNINGWQSEAMLPTKDKTELNKLWNEVVRKAKDIFVEYGVRSRFSCEKGSYWVNINPKGSANQTHIHQGSIMTAVFYVKGNDDAGDFCIDNNYKEDYINQILTNRSNSLTFSRIRYKPKTGSLLVLPSWVPHSVEMNKSEDDRISIAFNIGHNYG